MTTVSKEEFAKRMVLLARPDHQFVPTANYDPDGDCIEFLAKPDPFYAERVDDLITVYYSQETGDLIGSLIKRVSRFCAEMNRQMPGFKTELNDGRLPLVHIFRARLWSAHRDPHEVTTLAYRKLIDLAGETVVLGPLDALCLA